MAYICFRQICAIIYERAVDVHAERCGFFVMWGVCGQNDLDGGKRNRMLL